MIVTKEMLLKYDKVDKDCLDLLRFTLRFPNGLDISGLNGTKKEIERTWKIIFEDTLLRQYIYFGIKIGLLPCNPKANLSGMSLFESDCREVDFRATVLKQVNLTWSDLTRANFESVDLSKSDLSYCNFYFVNLRNANLQEVNFRHSYLGDADLRNANLYGADLRNVALYNASLEGANLTNIKKNNRTRWPKYYDYSRRCYDYFPKHSNNR